MERDLTCISCPEGCRLHVICDNVNNIKITGHKCARGELYGREEVLAPKRTLSAVVRTDSRFLNFAPVKTDKPILKKHIPSLLNSIYSQKAKVPVKRGDVLIQNFEDTGVNIIFSRNIPK